MNQRFIHNFIWIPIFIIGFMNLCLGLVFLFHLEPWVLNQASNEILIGASFDTLFAGEINIGLPKYLKALYSFHGLCIAIIGLLIIVYVQVTKMGTALARNSILSVLLFVLIGTVYILYTFIPNMLFKIIIILQILLWSMSVFSSTLIEE